MQAMNVILPTQTARTSPIVLATEIDRILQVCIDYRRHNDVTVYDSYPLRRMIERVDCPRYRKHFSSPEASRVYFQIGIKKPLTQRRILLCTTDVINLHAIHFI